jgi:hypothetical protein
VKRPDIMIEFWEKELKEDEPCLAVSTRPQIEAWHDGKPMHLMNCFDDYEGRKSVLEHVATELEHAGSDDFADELMEAGNDEKGHVIEDFCAGAIDELTIVIRRKKTRGPVARKGKVAK